MDWYISAVILLFLNSITWQSAICASLGCFEIDKLNRGFSAPPEDLDPSGLTQVDCLISCAKYDYAFAALEGGNMCLCSDTNTYSAASPVATTNCDVPCTGSGGENCGGTGYCEVFDSLNEAITVTLETGVTFVVGTSGSINIVINTGYQPEFSFDFGDGAAITEPITLTVQDHTYGIPGDYSVKCTAENGFLNGNQDVSDVQVDMVIDPAGVDLVCPTVEDLNNEFEITLTIFEGSRMLVEVDMGGDILPTFNIGTPAMYSVGFVAQGTRTDLIDGSDLNSGSTTWVLPGLEILQPGYVMSVEAYVTAPGTVNLLILKPICAVGSDVYCPHNNVCDSEANCNYEFDYPSNPVYTEYCTGINDIYCTLSGTCTNSGSNTCSIKNDRYDEGSPRYNYEVVGVIPVTFTVTGAYEYVKIPIADIKAGVVAEIGYIIGYETTSASIGWQNVTNNTVEYQYSAVSVGDTLDSSVAVSFDIQHYIRVNTVKELQTIILHEFTTYGAHDVVVNISNVVTASTVQKTCIVTIEQNITDLTLTMDNHTEVVSTEEATLFVWLQRGIPALLTIDWGDGTSEEVDRYSTTPDVPDNITHLFTGAGNLTVTVNASNLWNWGIFELETTVYNPVNLSAYSITTNSPQPNGLDEIKGMITISVSYTNGDVKPATFADVTISGGYAFDDIVKDRIYDIESLGDTCSLKIGFTYPGVYLLTLKFENAINSEEQEAEVEILDIIYGFEVIPRHIPVEEQHRSAVDGNLEAGVWYMPSEVPVLFTAMVDQGNDITYEFQDFGDGSPLISTMDGVYSHQYNSTGEYTVLVQGANTVSSTDVSTLQLKVHDSVQDIVVKEGPVVGKYTMKEFTIKIGKIGNHTCLVIDYGDRSAKEFYGDDFMCSNRSGYTYPQSLTNSLELNHNYTEEESYILQVEAFNYVSGLIVEHPFAITTLDCKVPDLTLRDHHPDISLPRLVQAADVLLISSITVIYCDETKMNTKSWNLTQVKETGEVVIDLMSKNPDEKFYTSAYDEAEIRFEEFKLNIGSYRFVYEVKMNDLDVEFISSITEYVEVLELPLNIAGVEGQVDRLAVGLGQLLEFSLYTYSTDPNIAQGIPQDINTFQIYCRRENEEWPSGDINEDVLASNGEVACADIDEDEFGGCFCGGPGMIFPENGTYLQNTNYTLNTSRMTVDTIYEIVFKGVKGENEGLRYLELQLIPEVPPQPIIRIADGTPFAASLEPAKYGQILNPNVDIRVLGECVQPCNISAYEWKLRPGNETDFNTVAWEEFPDEEQPTGITIETLFIPRALIANRLPTVHRYEIEFALVDSNNVRGIAAIKIAINLPPSDGTCKLESPNEISVGGGINVTCSDWKDTDGIAIYNIFTRNSQLSTDSLVDICESGQLNNLKPPMGPEADDYKLVLLIEVMDNLGSSTIVTVGDIFVRPPSPEDAAAELKELGASLEEDGRYDDIIAGGDTLSIAQIVSQDGSLLNGIRDASDKHYDQEANNLINTTTTASGATTEQLTELNNQEEVERNQRAEYRAIMTEVLSNAEMKSAKDILLVASAVSVVTNASDEVSDAAMESGLGLVTDMVFLLLAFSEEIDQNTLTEAGSNVITVLGNLLEGSAQSVNNPLTTANGYTSPSPSSASSTNAGTTADPQAQKERSDKARSAVKYLMSSVHSISKTLAQNKLPGEPATTVITPKITLQLMKDFAHMFGNETTYVGGGIFLVRSWCGGILPKEKCDPQLVINRQSMSSFKNPYNFEDSSNYIPETATAMTRVYRNGFNEDISVVDTPDEIEIFCPREGTPEPELTDYHPTDFNESAYICHSIEIIDNKTSLMFDFRPHESSIYYAVILQYDTKPNITDYDHIWFFGFNETGFSDSNKADGVYSETLPDSYIDHNTGVYYLCMAEVTPLPPDSYNLGSSDDDDVEVFEVGEGILVQLDNVTYNYSLVISTSGCRYWDSSQGAWSNEGCRIGPETNVSTTQCFCNHLTTFASSWFVPPAPLDFDYIFANAGFLENITIYCTTIAIYTLFIFIFIWARRKDKKDILKLGVTPLPDNSPADRYFYEITVLTGQRKAAGTDSKVNFILSGEEDETDVRVFDDDQRKILRRGGVDRFLMAVTRPLGALNYMRIWHDNGGKGKMQGWYLKYIVIKDLQKRKRYYFIVNRWFSVVEDDGQIDRLIAVAGKDEMQEFSHVFTNHTRKNLNDGHLWFSVLSRPAGSRFSRMQRAGCCLMALWLEMLVCIMFYKVIPPAGSENPVKLGPITITPASVMIGIESNLIVFPISLLVVNFFRKSRPRKKRKSRIMEACDRQAKTFRKNKLDRDSVATPSEVKFSNLDGDDLRENQRKHSKSKKVEQTEAPIIITTECVPVKKKRKERFGFPWWCKIIAWILTILCTATATVFVIFYGIQLGNEETSMWLASLFIGFFTAILFTQPIKVVLIAVFIACVIKTPGAEQEEDMDDDEEEFYLKPDEEWLHFPVEGRSRKIAYQPPNPEDLERAREQRLKEIKMFSIFREICFYSFFLIILMVVSYGNTNSMSYDVKDVLSSTFQGPVNNNFNKINTRELYWNWLRNVLVPALQVPDWYNGKQPKENWYIGDRHSLILGYAVVRQQRIIPDLCNAHEYFEDIIKHCNGEYTVADSDTSDYGAEWTSYNETREVPQFMYTTWDVLDSYPFLGRHGIYSGGGYVINLGDDFDAVQNRIDQLHSQHWIDKHTRAVFVEFSVYNPEVNLFGVVNMLVEFLPTGSLHPTERIDVIHLLRTYHGFAMFVIISEGIFIGFMVFFIFKEVNNFRREGKAYFYKFWNWIEFLIIAISVSGVVLYFYRHLVSKELVATFKEQGSDEYIKLQYVANWNEVFMYMLGTIVFLATTKFLKLLRFNRRMALLSSTLRSCSKDLFYFGIMFFVVFFAFVSIFYQLFVTTLFDFSDVIYTCESLIGTLLGAFDFESINAASGLLGPTFFFLYIAFMPFLLINMFLTILNESFTEVKHDIDKMTNDYEMVDFIMRHFKGLLGMNKARDLLHEKNNKDVDNPPTNEIEDKISEFPNKVDQLLDTIAKVYFDAEKFDDMITRMGGTSSDKPNLKKKLNKNINFVA